MGWIEPVEMAVMRTSCPNFAGVLASDTSSRNVCANQWPRVRGTIGYPAQVIRSQVLPIPHSPPNTNQPSDPNAVCEVSVAVPIGRFDATIGNDVCRERTTIQLAACHRADTLNMPSCSLRTRFVHSRSETAAAQPAEAVVPVNSGHIFHESRFGTQSASSTVRTEGLLLETLPSIPSPVRSMPCRFTAAGCLQSSWRAVHCSTPRNPGLSRQLHRPARINRPFRMQRRRRVGRTSQCH